MNSQRYYVMQQGPRIQYIRPVAPVVVSRLVRQSTSLRQNFPTLLTSLSHFQQVNNSMIMSPKMGRSTVQNFKLAQSQQYSIPDKVYHIEYEDGTHYFGYVNGKLRDGIGALLDKKKQIIYEGQWKDDKFDGIGVLTIENVTFKGQFKDGQLNGQGIEESKTYKYVGGFKNGKREGAGVLYEGTSFYQAFWKDGTIENKVD